MFYNLLKFHFINFKYHVCLHICIFRASDVLNWLNKLEFNKQSEILDEHKVNYSENNIKCRSNCTKIINECCGVQDNSYQTLNITNLCGTQYRFSYNNDSSV